MKKRVRKVAAFAEAIDSLTLAQASALGANASGPSNLGTNQNANLPPPPKPPSLLKG
jgi:hypothetical protein